MKLRALAATLGAAFVVLAVPAVANASPSINDVRQMLQRSDRALERADKARDAGKYRKALRFHRRAVKGTRRAEKMSMRVRPKLRERAQRAVGRRYGRNVRFLQTLHADAPAPVQEQADNALLETLRLTERFLADVLFGGVGGSLFGPGGTLGLPNGVIGTGCDSIQDLLGANFCTLLPRFD